LPQRSATASTFGMVPPVQTPTAEETTGANSAPRLLLQAQRHSISTAQHALRTVVAAAEGDSRGTLSAPTPYSANGGNFTAVAHLSSFLHSQESAICNLLCALLRVDS